MINFEELQRKLSDFDEFFVFSSMEEVREYVELRYQRADSISAIIKELSLMKFKFDIRGMDWSKIVLAIINTPSEKLNGNFEDVYLYNKELIHLKRIQNENVRKILYLSLLVMKWNKHPSGWIKFEREEMFKFWGLAELKNSEKELIMQEVTKNGMDLRVIGNKNPIICYHIKFVENDGEIMAAYRCAKDINQWWEWLVKDDE